jgi:putative transposase
MIRRTPWFARSRALPGGDEQEAAAGEGGEDWVAGSTSDRSESIEDVAKRHGISAQTIYIWKRRFGTMTGDEAKRLRGLEHENAKLKRMLTDRLLEIEVLKEINARKW